MPVASRNGSLNRLLPTEVVMIAYLVVTGLLILAFHSRLQRVELHLLMRAGIVVLFYLFSFLRKNNPANKFLELVRFATPFILLSYLYGETDYLNNLIFHNNLDPAFSSLEFKIFSSQPALLFAEKWNSPVLAETMYFGYFSYYCLVLGIPMLIFYKRDAMLGLKVSFIVICSFLIYYTIFILFPVAGPQFYFENAEKTVPKGFVFGPIMHLIQQYGEGATAAFPSSHVGICLLLIWAAFKYFKEILIVLIPVSMLLISSTIYLRAHYVIDIIAAIIVTPLMLAITKRIYRKLNQVFSGKEILLLNDYEARDY